MAWVLDTDGSARGSTTKTKGRGKARLPDENVGAVLAVCNLLTAINASYWLMDSYDNGM
jgi:hypothetical protein